MLQFSQRCIDGLQFEFAGLMHVQRMSEHGINYPAVTGHNNSATLVFSNSVAQCINDSRMKLPHCFPTRKHNFIWVAPCWLTKLRNVGVVRDSVKVWAWIMFSPTRLNSDGHRTKCRSDDLSSFNGARKITGIQSSCRNVSSRNQSVTQCLHLNSAKICEASART
ncbi:unannotated protein [freshwater metagenome]|uniref:Unannotated protein n=1 Tax=freshwater metagenome TaxID=449393 RepID=A0A6J6US31_9ZZZZ